MGACGAAPVAWQPCIEARAPEALPFFSEHFDIPLGTIRVVRVSVTIGERTFVIELPAMPGQPPCLDGRPIQSSLVEVRPGIYSLLLEGRSYELTVEPLAAVAETGTTSPAPVLRLTVNGMPVEARVEGERTRLLRQGAARRDPAAAGAITTELAAPMPGRVVAVPVEVGASVERGQTVVVLEAMKMESVLTAPAAGTVTAVLVTPGETVQPRQPLLRIEGA